MSSENDHGQNDRMEGISKVQDKKQLAPTALIPLPSVELKLSGWPRQQLLLHSDGTAGHPDEFWPDIVDAWPRVRLLKALLQYQASYGEGHVISAAVRVNAVLPGPVDTAAWDGADQKILGTAADVTALGILETPEEVASALTFLASPDATFITGASMVVDGGWSITKDSP